MSFYGWLILFIRGQAAGYCYKMIPVQEGDSVAAQIPAPARGPVLHIIFQGTFCLVLNIFQWSFANVERFFQASFRNIGSLGSLHKKAASQEAANCIRKPVLARSFLPHAAG